MRQVLTITERVGELVPPSAASLPPVLMGDFNQEPDSDEMRFLRGLTSVAGRGVCTTSTRSPSPTTARPARPSRATTRTRRRQASQADGIDYVYVRNPSARQGAVLSSSVVLQSPRRACFRPTTSACSQSFVSGAEVGRFWLPANLAPGEKSLTEGLGLGPARVANTS